MTKDKNGMFALDYVNFGRKISDRKIFRTGKEIIDIDLAYAGIYLLLLLKIHSN